MPDHTGTTTEATAGLRGPGGTHEACARISADDRLRAMAFRLEQGRDLRWRCTAVELGGPARPH
ncbi:Rv3235 family protein, partial [Streptomyces sp. NPDC057806]|uniref:Rv3235 family protein n=1 Tax=Streptomyces sp. NPDC057806 TaxID=3346255 RepID=UPI0036C836B9